MNVLERLGLTPSDVRMAAIMVGAKRPELTRDDSFRYVEGNQKAVWARVRHNEPVFLALAMMQTPTSAIAAIEGVSTECVLRRLRPVGLAKRGRPRVGA